MTTRKNKDRYPEEFELIKQYYTKALKQLTNSNGRVGHQVIRNMPIELYDLSIDILYNNNDEFSNQELRDLIVQVDSLIDSNQEKDFETDLDDNFNNLF